MGDLSVVEDTLKRISSHKGILGSVIINGDGIPIRQAARLPLSQPDTTALHGVTDGLCMQVYLWCWGDAAVCGTRVTAHRQGDAICATWGPGRHM